MDESVYDIEAGDDPLAGWHPGQPGNEVGGRRAARLAAAAAEAAAWTPTSPDVVAPAAPVAGGAVYDLSAELHPSDEQPWYVPGSTGGGTSGAPGPSPLVGGPAAVPPAQPHA
ncbi:hypothetical protein QP735_17320, partial [Curtobacterium citreum]|uniref:hypothetical protein n=1 Tax=Curtobacterium citreum TaxID=2036 RepID=UPI003D71CCD5|nr:hypothetical protein [Curtobacterium citreum]